MKYVLNENSNNDYEDIENLQKNILKMYGIDNYKLYLNPTKECENSYKLLNNIDKAVKCLLEHINNGDLIYSPTDSDVDGYCSNTMLIKYLQESFEQSLM